MTDCRRQTTDHATEKMVAIAEIACRPTRAISLQNNFAMADFSFKRYFLCVCDTCDN